MPLNNDESKAIRRSSMSGCGSTARNIAAPSKVLVNNATRTGNVSCGKLSAPGKARAASQILLVYCSRTFCKVALSFSSVRAAIINS